MQVPANIHGRHGHSFHSRVLIPYQPQPSSSTALSPVLLCAPAESLLQSLFSPLWVHSQLLELAQSCVPFLQIIALQGLSCRTFTNTCHEGAHTAGRLLPMCLLPTRPHVPRSAALDRAIRSSLLVQSTQWSPSPGAAFSALTRKHLPRVRSACGGLQGQHGHLLGEVWQGLGVACSFICSNACVSRSSRLREIIRHLQPT